MPGTVMAPEPEPQNTMKAVMAAESVPPAEAKAIEAFLDQVLGTKTAAAQA